MKEKTPARVAGLTERRDKLVRLRTTLKNKINNIPTASGVALKREVFPGGEFPSGSAFRSST